MTAHLFVRNGHLAWSEYAASGDPSHTHALVVDAGWAFILTCKGKLYLIGLGPMQFEEFSHEGHAHAAQNGAFGFRVVQDKELVSCSRDRRERRRRKLGRGGRTAREHHGSGYFDDLVSGNYGFR